MSPRGARVAGKTRSGAAVVVFVSIGGWGDLPDVGTTDKLGELFGRFAFGDVIVALIQGLFLWQASQTLGKRDTTALAETPEGIAIVLRPAGAAPRLLVVAEMAAQQLADARAVTEVAAVTRGSRR